MVAGEVRPKRARASGICGLALACAVSGAPAAEARQTPPPPTPAWSVSILFGSVLGGAPGGGEGIAQFPVGPTFVTEPGNPSRVNPSWFFGDGATLFNQVQQQFAIQFGETFPAIEPLDDLLRSAPVARRGTSFGVRVSRRVTPRVGVELEWQSGVGALEATDEAHARAEAARAGFESAFTGLLATVPASLVSVSATVAESANESGRTSIGGAMTFTLSRGARLETYVSGGGAWLFGGDGATEVRLRGIYRFRLLGTVQIDETDEILIRVTEPDGAFAGLLGGGMTYSLARRHALRADARVYLAGSGLTTSVEAKPSRVTSAAGAALPSLTSPSLQFSSLPTASSSLGGNWLTLETFKASGIDVALHVTVGYVFRF